MSKEAILGKIRSALSDVDAAEVLEVRREYEREGSLGVEARLELFQERIVDYKVIYRQIEQVNLKSEIQTSCQANNILQVCVPTDLPKEWLASSLDVLEDNKLDYQTLDACDGVITGCAVAIAETGSIALDGGKYQGRRVISLLPDYHLCIVFEKQVVDIVPEAVKHLQASVDAKRPITLISGPSATSDIELSRVEGVHGPRTLEVLLVRS